MKKTIKGYILGFLTAVILVGGASYAAQTVRIMLNGTELIPTDVTGKRVDPILVDGTTYLPVRAIADALGLNVGWDEATYTVSLDEPAKPEEEVPEEKEIKEDIEDTQIKEETQEKTEETAQPAEDENVIEGIGQIITIDMDDEISKIQDEKSKKIYKIDGVYMLGDWGSYRIVDGELEYFNAIDHYGWTRAKIEKTGHTNLQAPCPEFQMKLSDGTILTLWPRKVKINGTNFNLEHDKVTEGVFNAVKNAIGTVEIWYKTDEDGYVTKIDRID